MPMPRYAYDYSLSPARATGLRGALAGITVVGTVIAVSAISGALVTLHLFGAQSTAGGAPRATAAMPAPIAPRPAAAQSALAITKAANAPVAANAGAANAPAAASAPIAAKNHVESPATTAAVTVAAATPPAPATEPARPAPVAAAAQPSPAPIAESDLTFAKGYAQRRAIANGAVVRHGKVLVGAKTQLGRAAAVKAKPKVYARNNARTTSSHDRRGAAAVHSDAFGMFQRFERADQLDFNRHQALAFGEQRAAARRRNEAPARPSGPGNAPSGGFFGGLF
jgi:hypothetical protein